MSLLISKQAIYNKEMSLEEKGLLYTLVGVYDMVEKPVTILDLDKHTSDDVFTTKPLLDSLVLKGWIIEKEDGYVPSENAIDRHSEVLN